jgi:hypothetical protein
MNDEAALIPDPEAASIPKKKRKAVSTSALHSVSETHLSELRILQEENETLKTKLQTSRDEYGILLANYNQLEKESNQNKGLEENETINNEISLETIFYKLVLIEEMVSKMSYIYFYIFIFIYSLILYFYLLYFIDKNVSNTSRSAEQCSFR